MRRPRAALAALVAGLAVLAACSSGGRVSAAGPPPSLVPLGDHAQSGDVVLTSADNGRAVTIRAGQTVAAVVPGAFSVFVADSVPEPEGTPVSADVTAVLNPLGDGRFRAVGPGQAMLAAEFNCGPGASCARRWLVTVNVRGG